MKTSSLFAPTIITIFAFLSLISIGQASEAKVVFKVDSFESAPNSKKTWTKIFATIEGKSVSSISVVPDKEHMIVKDIDGKQDAKRLIFTPENTESGTYSWPFTISYIDKSGQTTRERYRAEYRKGNSPGFTIVSVE